MEPGRDALRPGFFLYSMPISAAVLVRARKEILPHYRSRSRFCFLFCWRSRCGLAIRRRADAVDLHSGLVVRHLRRGTALLRHEQAGFVLLFLVGLLFYAGELFFHL